MGFPGDTVRCAENCRSHRRARAGRDMIRFVLETVGVGEWLEGRGAGRREKSLEALCHASDDKWWQLGPHRWEQSRATRGERHSGAASASPGDWLGLEEMRRVKAHSQLSGFVNLVTEVPGSGGRYGKHALLSDESEVPAGRLANFSSQNQEQLATARESPPHPPPTPSVSPSAVCGICPL